MEVAWTAETLVSTTTLHDLTTQKISIWKHHRLKSLKTRVSKRFVPLLWDLLQWNSISPVSVVRYVTLRYGFFKLSRAKCWTRDPDVVIPCWLLGPIAHLKDGDGYGALLECLFAGETEILSKN